MQNPDYLKEPSMVDDLKEQVHREQRKSRRIFVIMGVIVVVCLIFALFAFVQKTEADRARFESMLSGEAIELLEEKMALMEQQLNEKRKEAESQRAIAVELEKMLQSCKGK